MTSLAISTPPRDWSQGCKLPLYEKIPKFQKPFVDYASSKRRNEVEDLAKSVDKSIKGRIARKPYVKLRSKLTPIDESYITQMYPEFEVHFDGDQLCPHPFARSLRALELELCINRLGVSGVNTLVTSVNGEVVTATEKQLDYDSDTPVLVTIPRAVIKDVGGNFATHALKMRKGVHCCSPLLSPADYKRRVERYGLLENISNYTTDPYKRDHYNNVLRNYGEQFHCSRVGQECKHSARFGIAVHVYDMTVGQVVDTMVISGMEKMVMCMIFTPEVLFQRSGIIGGPIGLPNDPSDPVMSNMVDANNSTGISAKFERTGRGKDELIHFSFARDSSLGYTHNYLNYREYFLTPIAFGDKYKGNYALIELHENRGGTQFIEFTLIDSRLAFNCPIYSSLSTTAFNDDIALLGWTTKHKGGKVILRRNLVILPKALYETILAYCLRYDKETFNAPQIMHYAYANQRRLIVNGSSVMTPRCVTTETLYNAVCMIYIIAYILRYDCGIVTKKIIDDIREVREINNSGPFTRLVRGFFRNLLHKKTEINFNILIDAMDKDGANVSKGLMDKLSDWFAVKYLYPIDMKPIDALDIQTMLNVDAQLAPHIKDDTIILDEQALVRIDKFEKELAPTTPPVEPENYVAPSSYKEIKYDTSSLLHNSVTGDGLCLYTSLLRAASNCKSITTPYEITNCGMDATKLRVLMETWVRDKNTLLANKLRTPVVDGTLPSSAWGDASDILLFVDNTPYSVYIHVHDSDGDYETTEVYGDTKDILHLKYSNLHYSYYIDSEKNVGGVTLKQYRKFMPNYVIGKTTDTPTISMTSEIRLHGTVLASRQMAKVIVPKAPFYGEYERTFRGSWNFSFHLGYKSILAGGIKLMGTSQKNFIRFRKCSNTKCNCPQPTRINKAIVLLRALRNYLDNEKVTAPLCRGVTGINVCPLAPLTRSRVAVTKKQFAGYWQDGLYSRFRVTSIPDAPPLPPNELLSINAHTQRVDKLSYLTFGDSLDVYPTEAIKPIHILIRSLKVYCDTGSVTPRLYLNRGEWTFSMPPYPPSALTSSCIHALHVNKDSYYTFGSGVEDYPIDVIKPVHALSYSLKTYCDTGLVVSPLLLLDGKPVAKSILKIENELRATRRCYLFKICKPPATPAMPPCVVPPFYFSRKTHNPRSEPVFSLQRALAAYIDDSCLSPLFTEVDGELRVRSILSVDTHSVEFAYNAAHLYFVSERNRPTPAISYALEYNSLFPQTDIISLHTSECPATYATLREHDADVDIVLPNEITTSSAITCLVSPPTKSDKPSVHVSDPRKVSFNDTTDYITLVSDALPLLGLDKQHKFLNTREERILCKSRYLVFPIVYHACDRDGPEEIEVFTNLVSFITGNDEELAFKFMTEVARAIWNESARLTPYSVLVDMPELPVRVVCVTFESLRNISEEIRNFYDHAHYYGFQDITLLDPSVMLGYDPSIDQDEYDQLGFPFSIYVESVIKISDTKRTYELDKFLYKYNPEDDGDSDYDYPEHHAQYRAAIQAEIEAEPDAISLSSCDNISSDGSVVSAPPRLDFQFVDNAIREQIRLWNARVTDVVDLCNRVAEDYHKKRNKSQYTMDKDLGLIVYNLHSRSFEHPKKRVPQPKHSHCVLLTASGSTQIIRTRDVEEYTVIDEGGGKSHRKLGYKADGILLLFISDLEVFNEWEFGKRYSPPSRDAIQTVFRDTKVSLVQGVPGCGKTTKIISDADITTDLILTTTREGRDDITVRMKKYVTDNSLYRCHIDDKGELWIGLEVDGMIEDQLYDAFAAKRIRTIDSTLLSTQNSDYRNVYVDEALMQHPGKVLLLAVCLAPDNMFLWGDIGQIGYVNRQPLIKCNFDTFDLVPTSAYHSVSYRCPVDIAARFTTLYSGGFTSVHDLRETVSVLYIDNIAGVPIKLAAGYKYLVFTQAEKAELNRYLGKSVVSTVHEYQGNQVDNVYLVRLNNKLATPIFNTKSYVLVALTRHRKSLVYYTIRNVDDLVAKMIRNKPSQDECDRAVALLKPGGYTPEFTPTNIVDGLLLLGPPRDAVDVEVAVEDIAFLNDGVKIRPNALYYDQYPHHLDDLELEEPACDMVEPSIDYLQSVYDVVAPGQSAHDMTFDSIMVQESDLVINVDNCVLQLDRRADMPTGIKRDTNISNDVGRLFGDTNLKPLLRTAMPFNRDSTMIETLLGMIKRNMNVPEMQGDLVQSHLAQLMYKKYIVSYVAPVNIRQLMALTLDPVYLNPESIAAWMRKGGVKSAALGNEAIVEKRLNEYKYMIKAQVKPKLDYSAVSEYSAVQTIAYHTKDVTGIFSPLFGDAHRRINALLRQNVVVYTEMTERDFARRVSRIMPDPVISRQLAALQCDISKYDKSQGEAVMLFNKYMYLTAGIQPELCEIWYNAHCKTVLKSASGVKCNIKYQRKSGDADTFGGNTDATMAIIACLVELVTLDEGLENLVSTYDPSDNWIPNFLSSYLTLLDTTGPPAYNYLFSSFAGDDSLILGNTKLKADTAQLAGILFNLETKFFSDYRTYYFCSRILVPGADHWYFVPDVVKMLCKLGRHDVRDRDHLEDYRISLVDLTKDLGSPTVQMYLATHISEMYKINTNHELLPATLYSLVRNPKAFHSLFVGNEGSTRRMRTKGTCLIFRDKKDASVLKKIGPQHKFHISNVCAIDLKDYTNFYFLGSFDDPDLPALIHKIPSVIVLNCSPYKVEYTNATPMRSLVDE